MTSRWKVELISKVLLIAILISTLAFSGEVRKLEYVGCEAIPCETIQEGSLIVMGSELLSNVLKREVARIDSLYFSFGYLDASVCVDTVQWDNGIDVSIKIDEGKRAKVRSIVVSGVEGEMEKNLSKLFVLKEGDYFKASLLKENLQKILALLNDSGYPYAQVWMTGFKYDEKANFIDITISVVKGRKTSVDRIVFDGLSQTDTSFVLRLCKLREGMPYNEARLKDAVRYLSSSGYFADVGNFNVRRDESGRTLVVIPLRERKRVNSFQGVIGFARRENDYILNGSVDLKLRNVAGTGRNASFIWQNTGERFSSVYIGYYEPFLFSLPFGLSLELKQVIQDSTYTLTYGDVSFKHVLGVNSSIVFGVAGDRSVYNFGELLKSTRQRYRVGASITGAFIFDEIEVRVDGVYRKRYFKGNKVDTDYQAIYFVSSNAKINITNAQSFFVRFRAEGIVSQGDVPLSEKVLIGGANTLRGFRENQFRCNRVFLGNFEYRFGRYGSVFVFDDLGVLYNSQDGWTLKNGTGFGLRSSSPFGDVVLSFGVGDKFSFEGTKVHVSLQQRF